MVNEIQKSIEAGFMTESPFKDFEIGNMSAENYAKIDLHKNIVDAITLVSESGKPVSYTHLDVYKRQDGSNKTKALSIALGIFVGLTPFYLFHTVIVLFLASFFKLNKLLSYCLLYTSRCV